MEAINGDHEVKDLVFILTCNHSIMTCATNIKFDLLEKVNHGLIPSKCFMIDDRLNI